MFEYIWNFIIDESLKKAFNKNTQNKIALVQDAF